MRSQSGSIFNPWLFTGRQFDQESGLYFYRNRYYEPRAGRFITRDPIGIVGGINLYGYVKNNPIDWFDPFGLKPGDPYPTQDTAARDAINDINPTSISEGREYGGWIYQNSDGTYSYTESNSGSRAGTSLGPVPQGVQITGDYHTHGANDPGYDNENFSQTDKIGNDQMNTTGYLGTPSGTIKRYDPSTSQETIIPQSGGCPASN